MPVIGFVSDAINGLLGLIDGAIQRINAMLGFYNRIPGLPNIPLIGIGGGAGIGAPGAFTGFTGGGGFGGGGETGGGFFGGGGGTGVGGTGGGTSGTIGGFGSVGEMTDRLLKIQDEIGALTFKYQTGQITKAQAQTALNKLKTEMSTIERAAATLGSGGVTGSYGAFAPVDSSRVTYGGGASIQPVTINVNAPSVIDETGFTRAVVDALNSVERRQGGGASALVGL
jgi:hypothetical protein